MIPSLRSLLFGRRPSPYRTALWLVVAVTLFATTLVAYAVGVFEIHGGVVFIPGDAALVGILAAGLVGYARGGLAIAWLVTFSSLLGYHADHAYFGLSYRPVSERLAYFLEPEGLFVFAVEALVVGVIAFALGSIARRGLDGLRSGVLSDS